MMQRRSFIGLVAAWAALSGRQAAGQRTSNLRRVAIVFIAPASDLAGTDLYFRQFVDAMREQGLVDGRNIIIERRSGDLQILKEAIPTISRVAVVADTALRGSGRHRRELDGAGGSMKLDLRWLTVDAPAEFASAFATMVREQADAVFVTSTAPNYAHLRRIADLAMTHRMPSFFEAREFAEIGGLLTYGWSAVEVHRNAAAYVRKILDGAKPADLPWGQPTKLELVINLTTAKALGLTIPQSLLLRADEVIQ